MNTTIATTDTIDAIQVAAEQAARLLKAGELAAVPTETVYGLAANALDPEAVKKIFNVKGRPAHNPLIVHVEGLEMARRCASRWDARAEALARAFWPGPLTLVVPKAAVIPDNVTAGGLTVGIRWSSHPFMRELISRCGFPLAAPSANLSNQVSPTHAGHVMKQLNGRIAMIVDGGPCHVGIESTVLDISEDEARILRPGMIHEESLLSVLQESLNESYNHEAPTSRALKSPGLLERHYSPRARLILARWEDASSFAEQASEWRKQNGSISVLCHSIVPNALEALNVCLIPHDPEAYARALYSELHRCDDEGADLIVVEEPPETPEWRGIRDRLRRAASGRNELDRGEIGSA